MKRIYILRHAKAAQATRNVPDDHARPLSPKGVEACDDIGDYLKSYPHKPSQIFSSTSERTRQTIELVLARVPNAIPVEFISRLYLADEDDLLDQVREADDTLGSLMLVGHNPGLHQFCTMLDNRTSPLSQKLQQQFPPGSLAVFEADIKQWNELRFRSGKLTDFVMPKEL